MKTLKDKKIRAYITSEVDVQLDEDITGILVIPYDDVKEAVLEDLEDITNLYNSITDDDIDTIKKKLEIHIRFKKRNFGNFKK